jgi:MarR family transcriptional regulator, transcriptional regulator for hemolysin
MSRGRLNQWNEPLENDARIVQTFSNSHLSNMLGPMLDENMNGSFSCLVSDISRLLRKAFDERMHELELTRTQWRVLVHLGRNEGMNQSSLAEVLEVRNITLGRHIDRLEETRWVERRRDPNDRRAYRLFLTAKARPIFNRMQTSFVAQEEEALDCFSPDERERLMARLEVVKDRLSRHA